MALKRKITKAEFDKLSGDIQAEYVEKDGEYVLDVDGEEDTGALRRAKDRAVQERREAERRAKEAEDKLAELDENDAKKSGDIEKLEAKWKKDKDDAVAEVQAKLDRATAYVTDQLVDAQAAALAGEISTSPALIKPHIRSRLKADIGDWAEGHTPETVVLDAQGQPSKSDLDAFKKELVDNKDFAPIIRASKASGGGAPSQTKGRIGGAGTQQTQTGDQPAPLSSLPPKDLAAQIAARKEAAAE